jgi:ABC-type phosphate transport system substrate-binding protein
MLAELVVLVAVVLQAGRDRAVPIPDLPFRVVVNSSNSVSSLSRRELSDIFMKRLTRWPDRSEILAVDQPGNSRIRDRFSRAIHGKSVLFVTRYWHRLIFSGRGIPPVEMGSSAAALEFVRANRGAIGYLDEDTPLDAGVKVVTVRR